VTFRLNMRTAAAILMSAATLVALAASGDTSSDSDGSNSGSVPAQSDIAKSSGGDNKPAKPSGPHYTLSQQNAIRAAKDYLSTAAFSKKGLIDQLSSSTGDGYPHKDAVFAVGHLHVDWKHEAVRAAKEYLHTSSFSCQGLIEQLSSSAGDKYTQEQAQYAANTVGLC
jgi:Host cell surface-exposed lipoprotein